MRIITLIIHVICPRFGIQYTGCIICRSMESLLVLLVFWRFLDYFCEYVIPDLITSVRNCFSSISVWLSRTKCFISEVIKEDWWNLKISFKKSGFWLIFVSYISVASLCKFCWCIVVAWSLEADLFDLPPWTAKPNLHAKPEINFYC